MCTPSVIMLSVLIKSFMLRVIMLNVAITSIVLSVIMKNVIMLNVAAPLDRHFLKAGRYSNPKRHLPKIISTKCLSTKCQCHSCVDWRSCWPNVIRQIVIRARGLEPFRMNEMKTNWNKVFLKKLKMNFFSSIAHQASDISKSKFLVGIRRISYEKVKKILRKIRGKIGKVWKSYQNYYKVRLNCEKVRKMSWKSLKKDKKL